MPPYSLADGLGRTVAALRENPKLRLGFTLAGAALLLFALGAFSFLFLTNRGHLDAYVTFVAMPALYGVAALALVATSKRPMGDRSYHESLLAERAALKRRLAEAGTVDANAKGAGAPAPRDVQDVIFLNLNQMEEFYVLTIRQARNAFRASILAISVGLLTLVVGIFLFYLGNASVHVAALSTVSGIILQFVGITYSSMHRRASEKMNYYYDQLVRTQDTMLAVRIAAEVEDAAARTTARMGIISRLVDRPLPKLEREPESVAQAPPEAPARPVPVEAAPPAA